MRKEKFTDSSFFDNAADYETQGFENVINYIKEIINLILKDVVGFTEIQRHDPWCPGYFRRDPNECCGSDDTGSAPCDNKHPLIGIAKIIFLVVLVLMFGAITYRMYKMIRYVLG